jgi:hypothetical protein
MAYYVIPLLYLHDRVAQSILIFAKLKFILGLSGPKTLLDDYCNRTPGHVPSIYM